MVSRCVANLPYYKKRLEEKGYTNVAATALEKDALDSLIREMKPDIVLMGARFYECATPYMMWELKNRFPDIYYAALCIGYYPEDLAMYFILNGVKSYVTTFYGLDLWDAGLEEIRLGRQHINPAVNRSISSRKIYPAGASRITKRRMEVLRFVCCGFKDHEIADMLWISKKTVENHKTEIFKTMNVRDPVELVLTALKTHFVKQEELYFYPRKYVLSPFTEKREYRGRR